MILKALHKKDAAPAEQGVRQIALSELSFSQDADAAVSEQAAMRISAVSACVEIISSSIAIMPMFLFDENTKQRLADHSLGRVLWHRPNDVQTPFDFLKFSTASILTHGNSYVWNYRNGFGEIVERIPLLPGLCTPARDLSSGRWFYIATDPKRGIAYRLDPSELSHYRIYAADGVSGVSVLSRAARTIRTAESADRYQQAVFRSGGRPSGVLQTDSDLGGMKTIELANGEKAEISIKDFVRREWERIYAGPDNAFKTAILDKGLKYTAIAATAEDLQFVQSKQLSVSDIARFFCIPPYKLGEGKQSYQSNEQNNIEFAQQTLQPLVTQREQEDTAKLLLPSEVSRGIRIRQDMRVLLRGDEKTRAEVERIRRDTGVYSVNDIRHIEDMPEVPGGDTRYASRNYMSLEQFGKEPADGTA